MTYYTKADEATEAFFRQAATNEGLSYTAWCKKYGILGPAALHRIADNELSREALSEDGVVARFVSPQEWTGGYKSHSGGVTGSEDCVGLQHDAGGICPVPKVARRRQSRSDAAEAAD